MLSQGNTRTLVALTLFLISTGAILCPKPSLATDDAVRDELAKKDCKRGKFNDYYLQGRGGDPAGDYAGRVFKLSQDYPSQLSPMEKYPWLKISFKNGGPVDPEAYLRALLD